MKILIDETSTKSIRQWESIQKWGKQGCKGTVVAATGFGKSVLGIRADIALRTKYPVPRDSFWDAETIIIVPTIDLKNQWEDNIERWGLDDVQVWVVNSIVLDPSRILRCRLLILDEIHKYSGEVFRNVFEQISYESILGLTAKLPNRDEKTEILYEICPVIDEIGMEECLKNGWISSFTVYNYGVELTPEERLEYDKASAAFSKGFGFFGSNIKFLFKVMNDSDALADHARNLGVTEGHLRGLGGSCIKGLRKRNDILKKATNKVNAAVDIINSNGDKRIITFAEFIETAEEIYNRCPEDAEIYHSDLKGRDIHGTYYGKKAFRKLIIDRFKDKVFNRIYTAKALDIGADFPDLDLGIIISGTASPIQTIQRYGRVVREMKGKDAIIFEIYALSTQDETSLRRKQVDIPRENIVYITGLDEVNDKRPN